MLEFGAYVSHLFGCVWPKTTASKIAAYDAAANSQGNTSREQHQAPQERLRREGEEGHQGFHDGRAHGGHLRQTQVSKPREGVVGLREELIKKVPDGLHNELKKVLQYGA